MLWIIVVVLVVLWLLGLVANVGGGLIHALLVIAAVVVVVNLLRGRRALVQLQLRRSVLYSTGHAKSTDLCSTIDC